MSILYRSCSISEQTSKLLSRLEVCFQLRLIVFFFFIITFFSCKETSLPAAQIMPAFYHWQTNIDLSPLEKDCLQNLNISKIYPKFFDVDWDFNRQKPTALATLEVSTDLPDTLEIVPTIFITNRTFVQLPQTKIEDLADKIYQKLNGQMTQFEHQEIQEIQFDCDWTASTKDKYFLLLKMLNKHFISEGIFLSATIRLHQIKYAQKTGIPPVQRGMLMYYNMGKVQSRETENSILDNTIGRQYLEHLADYPLPLDIALPLFQWGVLFRNGELIKLINQLSESALVDKERFVKLRPNTWEVRKSTYLNGYYLYEQDIIRLEKVIFSELHFAAKILNSKAKKENRTVVFYHLEEEIIQNFSAEELSEIWGVFAK